MSDDALQPEAALPERPRQPRARAIASAQLALSLAELLRAGTGIPQALTAIAARRRQGADPLSAVFERIALAVREEGQSVVEAVLGERRFFTERFIAILALANLSGPLFKTFIERLRQAVWEFNARSAEGLDDFPPMQDEVQEFCFYLGHLANEKASQPEVQRWLPRVFTARLRLQATLVLGRFYDQGLLLSEAFARTPPFNDPEMVLAVQAGEEINRVGRELIELARWLRERRVLEERLRLTDFVVPSGGPLARDGGGRPARPGCSGASSA